MFIILTVLSSFEQFYIPLFPKESPSVGEFLDEKVRKRHNGENVAESGRK